MATYQDQFKSAFDKYSTAWKNQQQVYEALKTKLSSKPEALASLEDYYKTLSWWTQPWILSKTPDDFKVQDYKASNEAFYKLKTRPDGKVEFTSAQTWLPKVFDSKELAIANIEEAAKKNPPKIATQVAMTAAPSTGISKITETINTSLLDKDTASHMRNQVNAINQQYLDKIKNQQEYAKNIMDAYNANKAEFDAKYKDMRDTVNRMENELNSNYSQLKDSVATNYKEWMDTYARQAAASQAWISGTLSKSWISWAALSNALAESLNDPKRLWAIQSLKDKQITDITNLQNNYNTWYNNLLSNKATLTTAEKQLADTILERKDKLDTELASLKNENITDVYKPLTALLADKTDKLSWIESAWEMREKSLSDFLTATPARKKDILLYNIWQQDNTLVWFIDESLLNEAIKKWSMPDAITYLMSQAKAKSLTATWAWWTNPSSTQFKDVNKDTTALVSKKEKSIEAVQKWIDKVLNANKGKDPSAIISEMKARLKKEYWFTDDYINQKFKFWEALTPTVDKWTSTSTVNKWMESTKAELAKQKWWTAEWNKYTWPDWSFKEFWTFKGVPSYKYYNPLLNIKTASQWTPIWQTPNFYDSNLVNLVNSTTNWAVKFFTWLWINTWALTDEGAKKILDSLETNDHLKNRVNKKIMDRLNKWDAPSFLSKPGPVPGDEVLNPLYKPTEIKF